MKIVITPETEPEAALKHLFQGGEALKLTGVRDLVLAVGASGVGQVNRQFFVGGASVAEIVLLAAAVLEYARTVAFATMLAERAKPDEQQQVP